jgi:hypothetical protein
MKEFQGTAQQAQEYGIELKLSLMVKDAMDAIMRSEICVERDIDKHRVKLVMIANERAWYIDGKREDVKEIIKLLTYEQENQKRKSTLVQFGR